MCINLKNWWKLLMECMKKLSRGKVGYKNQQRLIRKKAIVMIFLELKSHPKLKGKKM